MEGHSYEHNDSVRGLFCDREEEPRPSLVGGSGKGFLEEARAVATLGD